MSNVAQFLQVVFLCVLVAAFLMLGSWLVGAMVGIAALAFRWMTGS